MRAGLIIIIGFIVCSMTVSVHADYYLAGSFNNWDPAGTLMTDNGDGTYTASLSGLTFGNKYEFKVTTDGSWDNPNYPAGNCWLFSDASGNATVMFNTNTVSDGWSPAQNRIIVDVDPTMADWILAGNFQGWDKANPATTMMDMGNGLFWLEQTWAAGNYSFKAVQLDLDQWYSISQDGRSVATANMDYTVAADTEVVNFFIDTYEGVIRLGWASGADLRTNVPYDASPALSDTGVPVSGLMLSWSAAEDPNIPGIVDPNLASYNLYLCEGSWDDDPNLVPVETGILWDGGTLRATASAFSSELKKDTRYFWRVGSVMDDGQEVPGTIWFFDTESAGPEILSQPDYAVVEATNPAVFEVGVLSATMPTYQWYKIEDGTVEELDNNSKYSGTDDYQLTVSNVDLDDEAGYYCVVGNESVLTETSDIAVLGVKRRIAYWDFEDNDYQSQVTGSPETLLHNDPDFTSDSAVGLGAMEFDNDEGLEDMLYTDPDPNEVDYFDICNHSMTIVCWIKSSYAETWGPMVARNGEDGGWALRHSGASLDRICLTTRGTEGNEDGTVSDRTVYDGDWHQVVATVDNAAGEKKIYIDGVVSRVYGPDKPTDIRDADSVSGLINSTMTPVSLGGRIQGSESSGLTFDRVTAAILDDISIYNYVKSSAEISQDYADMTNSIVCASVVANDLNGDCIVNMEDLALLSGVWLTDGQVQPTP